MSGTRIAGGPTTLIAWLAAALAAAVLACAGGRPGPASEPVATSPAPAVTATEAPPQAPAAPATEVPAAAQPAAPQPAVAPPTPLSPPPVLPLARQAAPMPPPAPPAAQAPPDAAPPQPTPTPGPLLVTLDLSGQSFNPHQIHGNAGQPVVVTLLPAPEAHSFTIPTLGVDVSLRAGERRTVQFVVPVDGTSSFYCRIHGTPSSGMHGLLIFH